MLPQKLDLKKADSRESFNMKMMQIKKINNLCSSYIESGNQL